ncbi:tRNA 2-thiocytidine biosynthesis TtcA family protein [Isachenkonia alkalipeptolytica]|uniref:tRNA 2-thiocytidine biosynthesis protein TtcA n=1 Tax=Isachenkonia alkalipeptolytica TaxID=2565777 RepID=A0AA43XI81_9CLOT|nr:ATP-binding protein [Isachenkonia alkalipeptolytica]NBG87293.1 tRNA 2-thiocytidine biosynthesis protein TtcA [Isachenkonia alkalipeptolytica]
MTEFEGAACGQIMPEESRKPLGEIEKLMITKYRKKLWTKFIKGVKDYQLIQSGDKIAVAISGGKDSLVMAKLFQELRKNGIANFDLEFIAMDPGYHPSIKELLVDNCKHLNIPLHIFEYQVFEIAQEKAKDYPCYICAKMRRGALYAKAKELGCNKVALGHHYNDVIETTMLNLFYTGNFKTMLPKLKAQNFDNMELIRPMYLIEEKDITAFTENSGIWPLNCACMVASKKIGSKREEMKTFIENMKETFPHVDRKIFRAGHNVNMDCIIGWQKDGEKHSYLEEYDKM